MRKKQFMPYEAPDCRPDPLALQTLLCTSGDNPQLDAEDNEDFTEETFDF